MKDRDYELWAQIKETFDMTTREMVTATIGWAIMAVVLYYGTIGMMAMLYAVTGVRQMDKIYKEIDDLKAQGWTFDEIMEYFQEVWKTI